MAQTIRACRLATFVTATKAGPVGTPLPLLYDEADGEFGTLHGHLARANPQWRTPMLGLAMVVFAGPDAYVTPSWYASKREHGKVVPTWNYVAVHAYGEAEFYEDADRLLGVVTALTRRHEETRADPWAVRDAPPEFTAAQLKGIVGLHLRVTRLEGKRKLSQNRSQEDRAGVAAGLSESTLAPERQIGTLIPQA